MNRVKKMNDNAFIESFFHQFKTERIKHQEFDSAQQLRAIVTEYICYYNNQRSHSSIGYVSPQDFECKMKC
ncbi:integrase core domain-containing protein [Microbulbifer sp. ANSA002]